MNEVIFVCDESGDKRFADKPEEKPRQIGVVAGVLIPQAKEALIRQEMDALVSKFPPPAGEKQHITSLSQVDADACRQAVFDLIRKNELTCIYGAIATQGFHEQFKRVRDIVDKAKAAVPTNIVDLNPKFAPERLHSSAFAEAFANATACCLEGSKKDDPIQIAVRTDQLDQAILKEFQAAAKELLDEPPGGELQSKFYDKKAKMPVTTVVRSTFEGAENYGPITNVKCTFDIDDSSLAFLADVIANNFYDHLRKKFERGLSTELNNVSAFDDHPLQGHVFGPRDDNQPALADVVYRYPQAYSEVTLEEVVDDLLTDKDGQTHD